MSIAIIDESLLTNIADAIRTKTGSSDTYTPAEMAEAIADISTGGTPTGTKQITINAAGTVTEDVTNYANVQITTPSGSAGTPTATKGSVSNHAVSVTPSVTNTTGYITGSTKTGTAVSVSASELVSGTLNVSSNGTQDVTNYASINVNVSSGGSSKNVQVYNNTANRKANSYGATSATLTVAKTGTYKITWCAARGSSSGTMGTNLHIGNTAETTNHETWTGTYWQHIELTNKSLTKDQVITLYATSGSNSRTIYVGNLTIEEQ